MIFVIAHVSYELLTSIAAKYGENSSHLRFSAADDTCANLLYRFALMFFTCLILFLLFLKQSFVFFKLRVTVCKAFRRNVNFVQNRQMKTNNQTLRRNFFYCAFTTISGDPTIVSILKLYLRICGFLCNFFFESSFLY